MLNNNAFCLSRDGKLSFHNWETQLRKGLLDIAILNFFQHGQCYGYKIVQALKLSKGLKIREGNIYSILSRMEKDGLITSSSAPSRDGPTRKYFELTRLGQKVLAEMNACWDRILESVERVREGNSADKENV